MQTNFVLVTQYVANPNIVGTVEVARDVSQLIPIPYADVVASGLGLFAAVIGAYARMRTKQLNKKSDILKAVIAGVEAGAKVLGNDGKTVKVAIENQATMAGVEEHLNTEVQETLHPVNRT